MMHTVYHIPLFIKNLLISSLPLSAKFINFPPIFTQFTFCLIYVLLIPLFWPCCTYASCFKLNGHPFIAKVFHISRKFRYTFLDLTAKNYEINKSPKCAPFRMRRSKSRRFLGLRSRPRWGAYDAPSDPLVVRGFLPSAIAASRLRRLQFSQLRPPMIPKLDPPPFLGQIIHCKWLTQHCLFVGPI